MKIKQLEMQVNRATRRKMNRITTKLKKKNPNMSIQELAETAAMVFRGEGLA